MNTNTETPQASLNLGKLGSDLEKLANPSCDLCPLHEETERVCIPVNAPTLGLRIRKQQVRPILIGEAPGYNEEYTGRLFSGAAGKLLDKTLEEVGLNRDWFFVTNAVKCRPEENRNPTPKEIRTCTSTYLSKELELIKPQFGLALGNGGCQAVLGKKGITKLNGTMQERYGVQWIFAFHPAAVLRNPRYKKPFHQALLIFARLLRDEEGIPKTQTTLVNDKLSLHMLISEFKKEPKVASVDVETWSSHPSVGRFKGGGLAWWAEDFKVCTINFTFKGGYSYVLALDHQESKWDDWTKVRDIIKPYMEAVPKWVMQNGKFDSKCLEMIGIHIRHSFDTMGAEYAMDENNIKDLGFLSQVYLGAPPYKELVDKSNIYHEDLNKLAEYGGMDSDYTFRLRPIMIRRFKDDPISRRLYTRLLHPADLTLTNVELVGVPLDADKLAERTIECEGKIADVQAEVFDLAGWEFNLRSPTQVADILHNKLGFPVKERTMTGKPSTREGVLLQLKGMDESGIIDSILEYRQWSGYLSRYLTPWPRLADSDWRLHTHFKPYHTVTGRLSSESPNLQQVPRNTFIRGIIGGTPGWKIVEADYSQAEMRIAAHYSQDRTMGRIFNTGRDIHMETAMSITGLTEDEVATEQRKMAKSVNFGFLYGMGWKHYIEYAAEKFELKVTESEAQEYRREFFRNFRSLAPWHGRQRKKAKMNGYVMSAIGRKRRLHDIESTNDGIRAEAERQAINSPVQSLASDMMLLAMIQLEKRLPGEEARLISTVHDSIIFEIREDKVDKWIPIIRDEMENVPLERLFDCILTIPIVVDIKVGDYWSEGSVEV